MEDDAKELDTLQKLIIISTRYWRVPKIF